MSNKKIIFAVGHANWGKSLTLKLLTNNNRYLRNYTLGTHNWFIRRMSNDDQPDGYYEFIRTLDPKITPRVIAAFCPNFDEERNNITAGLLDSLKDKGYELYFWVLEKQFNTNIPIEPSYIEKLKSFGEVWVYSKHEEAKIRALDLKQFIEKHA